MSRVARPKGVCGLLVGDFAQLPCHQWRGMMKTRLGIVAVTIGRFAAGAGVAGICAACSVAVPLTLVPEPSGSGSWGVLRGTATASGTGSGPVIFALADG